MLLLKNGFNMKNLPISIMSAELFYLDGDFPRNEELVGNDEKIVTLVGVEKRGFYP